MNRLLSLQGEICSVSFYNQILIREPQHFVDQAASLVPIIDDDGVDALVNALDGEL